jgi:hypothetical protein
VVVEQHTTRELAVLVVLVLVETEEMGHQIPQVEMERMVVEAVGVVLVGLVAVHLL